MLFTAHLWLDGKERFIDFESCVAALTDSWLPLFFSEGRVSSCGLRQDELRVSEMAQLDWVQFCALVREKAPKLLEGLG